MYIVYIYEIMRYYLNFKLRLKYTFLILVFIIFNGFTTIAQHTAETQKITASDRFQNEQFGFCTAIAVNYMIVGAVDEGSLVSGRATTEGAAYIYKKSTNNEWIEMQKIVASDRMQDDHFGKAVAITENFAFVAATGQDFDPKGEDEKAFAGAVYVFKRNTNNEWIQHQKLVASDRERNGSFGNSITISNNQLIIGSSHESSDPGLGTSVTTSGAIYIFTMNSNGEWYETQKLMASDRSAQAYFGHSIALSGNYIAVGAYWEKKDVNGENEIKTAGAVYMFKKNSDGFWEEHQKITPSDRAKYDFFGFSVAMDGDNLLIGSYRKWKNEEGIVGAAYMFKLSDNDIWIETQKLEALDWGKLDAFGRTVAIKDNIAIIGAPGDYDDKNGGHSLLEAGSVYIFTTDDCEHWHQVEKFTPIKRGYSAGFGVSIAYTGHDLIISAPDESHDNNNSNEKHEAGAVYVFNVNNIAVLPCNTDTSTTIIESPDDITPIDFGVTISIDQCSITLTANEENGTYQWIDCSTGIELDENGTQRVYKPTKNGTYAVILTKNDTTLISDCMTVKVVNEVSENDSIPVSFRVTPNPNNGVFDIIVVGKMTKEYPVDITNPFGISMQKLTLIQSVTQVNLGRVNKGIYIIKIKTDDGLKRIPIYVE